MKTFIATLPKTATVEVSNFFFNGDNIVAYKTHGPTGYAILTCDSLECPEYGFMYMRDMLQGNFGCNRYYCHDDPKTCIMRVIQDGKEVLYFKDYEDFIRHITL